MGVGRENFGSGYLGRCGGWILEVVRGSGGGADYRALSKQRKDVIMSTLEQTSAAQSDKQRCCLDNDR